MYKSLYIKNKIDINAKNKIGFYTLCSNNDTIY